MGCVVYVCVLYECMCECMFVCMFVCEWEREGRGTRE